MNTLSWMIYGASLSQSVGGLCMTLTIFGVLGGVLGWVIAYMRAEDCWGAEAASTKAMGNRLLRLGIILAIPAAILGTVVPDQKTVLMIAASEAGQRVYDDPANQPVITALREALTAKMKEASK